MKIVLGRELSAVKGEINVKYWYLEIRGATRKVICNLQRLSEDMETSWSASTTPGSKVPVLSRAETKLVRNLVCWDLGRSCQAARSVSDRRLEAILVKLWTNSITMASLCSLVGMFLDPPRERYPPRNYFLTWHCWWNLIVLPLQTSNYYC